MNYLRQRQYLFALMALLLVFAACKGESPTAPPPVSGPGGPTTPPVGATVALTVSNPAPLTNSSSTVTATVTISGQPAPAGTAVEFSTNFGTFEETGTRTAIRTTNAQGQATVRLTSAAAGTATITAVVNNVIQTTAVTFSPSGQQPPTPTSVTVTGHTPDFGGVEGGTVLTITGTNFAAPVRVFFDLGGGDIREGFVTSVTPTQIQVVTPQINLTSGQTVASTVRVVARAGTEQEARADSPEPFTFRRAQLTPTVSAVSPSSGPLEGGTRVTLFGDGFEPFVQVFFGLAEAQIVNVRFNEIVVVSPNSRDTTNDASPVAGQVPIRVVNVNSRTEGVLSAGFRYHQAVSIVAIGPTEGPFTGGTRVRIDGTGFDDPVAVTIAGVGAQVISVSGTQIVAQTSGVTVTGCSDVSGPISVTNINTGAGATAGDVEFTYRVPQPIIISVSNPTVLGGTITIRVFGAFGFHRLRLGNTALNILSETVNADGTTTFTAVVPTTLELDAEECAGVDNVTALQPTAFDVTYESATTGCTDTAERAATILPPATPLLRFSPTTFTPFNADINPGNPAAVPPVPPSVAPSEAQIVNVVNAGQTPLTVTAINTAGAGCAFFTISAPPVPLTLGTCEAAPIFAQYNGSTTPGTHSCTLTVTTDAGTRSFTLTGISQ
jgi:hypothetical protein